MKFPDAPLHTAVNRLAGVADWIATGPPAFMVRPLYHRVELQLWKARGRRGLTPHAIKQRVVRDYAVRYRLRVLVETGTYLGDMVWAVRRDFRQIHSIELDPALHARAVARFSRHRHVHLIHGDSAAVLGDLIASLREPALFWLDGHYSGGITARGSSDTPVLSELDHVFGDHRHQHVVLIDDARDFAQNNAYPSLEELKDRLRRLRPGLTMDVAENIIRVQPSTGRAASANSEMSPL